MTLYYVPQFVVTKLSVGGGIDDSQTTGIVLQSTDGLDISKAGVACLTWADPLDSDLCEWVSFTSISAGKELQGVTRGAEGSTARAHLNDADIAFPISKSHINNVNDKLRGVDTALAEDVHGNEVIKTAHNDSAVNEVTVTNAATGNAPEVSATGGDTNIDLKISPKGSGVLILGTWTGWHKANETWTYASANTFTVSGNQTARYAKGTRLKFTNSTAKYGVVIGSSYSAPNTTVTIAINTDYVIENAAISANYFSYESCPQGYPTWFAYNGTPTGATGSVGTYAEDNATARFKVDGTTVTVHNTRRITNVGSWTGNFQMPLPVNAPANKYVAISAAGGIFVPNAITVRAWAVLANAGVLLFTSALASSYLAFNSYTANDWMMVYLSYEMA